MKKTITIMAIMMTMISGCGPGQGADADGDGFINCAMVVDHWPRYDDAQCYGDNEVTLDGAQPQAYGGYNPLVHDCDDSDPDINPGAAEICDGLDNDCDGIWDEGSDANDLDLDCDGDGFVKLGIVSDGSDDCDPWDAAVNPDAPELVDGQDNNCDGICAPEECSDDSESACPCRLPIDISQLSDPGCQCGTGSSTLSFTWLLALIVIGLRRRSTTTFEGREA